MSRSLWLRRLYAVVVGAVALGGLAVIVDWAVRGDELPRWGVPVTGRVIEEHPGFSGAPGRGVSRPGTFRAPPQILCLSTTGGA